MGIILLGALIIFLIYCILFNWKVLGAILGGLVSIALCGVVGFGALYLLFAWLGTLA